MRAFIGRAQWTREPVTRWYYIGPMFRHERAQRGRLRQFHQVGAELFGVAEPTVDAEMIAMLAAMLARLRAAAVGCEITVNSLGEPEERAGVPRRAGGVLLGATRRAGRGFAPAARDQPAAHARLEEPRRCRRWSRTRRCCSTTWATTRSAASTRVRASLAALGVANELDPRLVRGLDYYTGTIFEIKVTAGDLGAQNTVVGGGRYDRLVESLGGPRTPALGFGMGIERMLLALPETAESFEPALNVFFAPLDAAALDYALPLAHRLRAAGVRVEIEHRTASLKSQLKRADKLRARLAVIIGENEVKSGAPHAEGPVAGHAARGRGRRARGEGPAGAGLAQNRHSSTSQRARQSGRFCGARSLALSRVEKTPTKLPGFREFIAEAAMFRRASKQKKLQPRGIAMSKLHEKSVMSAPRITIALLGASCAFGAVACEGLSPAPSIPEPPMMWSR